MTNEMIMEILKADRCTEREAKNLLKMGTDVIEADTIDGFLEQWNEGMEEDEIITKENIEAGKVEQFSCVTYEGSKFYIVYVV